jgi:hypothetical protein
MLADGFLFDEIGHFFTAVLARGDLKLRRFLEICLRYFSELDTSAHFAQDSTVFLCYFVLSAELVRE